MATRSLIDKQFPGIAKRVEEAQKRLDAKAKDLPEEIPPAPGAKTKARLTPDRHPQKDFFIADIFDTAPKDDMASMEHPLFALKTGDMRVRKYERNGNSVEIKPGFDGCATIHDKDIWIYCISQLVEAINRGREDTNRTVRFTAYDFLVSTNRPTDGDSYKRMAAALERLGGTRITTNIATVGYREKAGFGLIDSWRVIERSLEDQRMVAVEVTLPDWLWRSVKAKQVLTLSRNYFRIRKPLDRRIYELVRKHCGDQAKWRVSIKVLYEKSGSAAKLIEFRRSMRALASTNDLPDYRVEFDQEADTMTFYAHGPKGTKAKLIELFGDHTKSKRDV
jgi:plasmid replication initiation protein